MISATRYPAFSRNFEDEQDYADAAVRANSSLSGVNLSPILRWKRRQQQGEQDGSSTSSVRYSHDFVVLQFPNRCAR